MNDVRTTGRIAVIGMGPRGLGALEALAVLLPSEVDVFDPLPPSGAGPNFDPAESDLCRLNIPMRDIEIRARGRSSCGTLAQWLGDDAPGPDVFPPRAYVGRYLEARYSELVARGPLKIRHKAHGVDRVEPSGGGWQLQAAGRWFGPYAEVLLAPGQPQVEPDDQLAEWQDHAAKGNGTLLDAYPARRLQDRAEGWTDASVAVRGMALSLFDILRVLTLGQGGRFENGRYLRSGAEPAGILPCSLDGKPPFPKPETMELDGRYEPLPGETESFAAAISLASRAGPAEARALLKDALTQPVARILHEAGAPCDPSQVDEWLETEWVAPGSQETGTGCEILGQGIAMADGSAVPTIGYTVGQVWRKWQDPLRSGYNSAHCGADTARTIVHFDEGLKRYSYGPPVSSARELAALVDAGLVDLESASDPDIAPTESGWRLSCDGVSRDASIMIDGVLPPPDLGSVTAGPVAGLVANCRLTALGKKLAARTDADGTIIDADGHPLPGLCLLGRMALGSVVAADSLHDCFGESAHRWARGVLERAGQATAAEMAADAVPWAAD